VKVGRPLDWRRNRSGRYSAVVLQKEERALTHIAIDEERREASTPRLSTRVTNSMFRTPKTAELVADHLRGQIIRRELEDGAPLPNEAILAGSFGVSRPTLREALRILEAESLIQITRGSRTGARVVSPSERGAAQYLGRYFQFKQISRIDVHQAVAEIEVPALVALVTRGSVEDVDALVAHLEIERQSAGDWKAAVDAATAFHRLLVDRSGVRSLAILHGLLDGVIVASSREIARIFEARTEANARDSRKIHAHLVSLIRDGDGDGAAHLWRRHLHAKVRVLEEMTAIAGEGTLVEVL
jgi:DNA-binding FadR family transcriptional regulator